MIKEKRIVQVKEWNREQRANENYILVYTLGNGSTVDIPRQRGYVVQKRYIKGGERSKFYLSHAKATEDYLSDNF